VTPRRTRPPRAQSFAEASRIPTLGFGVSQRAVCAARLAAPLFQKRAESYWAPNRGPGHHPRIAGQRQHAGAGNTHLLIFAVQFKVQPAFGIRLLWRTRSFRPRSRTTVTVCS